VTDAQIDADTVRKMLSIHEELVHVSVEINRPGRGNAADGLAAA